MKKPTRSSVFDARRSQRSRAIAAVALSALPFVPAQAQPAASSVPSKPTAPPTQPGTLDHFFNGRLPDSIGKAKINVNARLRYEFADQDAMDGRGPKDSTAVTLRTRFGLTTAPLYGFQAMVEGENIVSLIRDENYNAAGSNGQPERTVIADPETTELNQVWLSYGNTNWMTTVKGGGQRIALDNHRFVGDVGWRQNQQTFNAVSLESKIIPGVTFHYSYLWDVNRVFGDVDELPPQNQDFDANSHVVNAAYTPCKFAKITGYAYLLDLENGAGTANSSATYGAYVSGTVPLSQPVKLEYKAEFAWQTDYADSPLDYEAEYYNLEAGVNVKRVTIGVGYEVLGTDNNQGFRTPLATLHAFNGWADVFLNTPAKGLRDLYPFVQVQLPGGFAARAVYHKFDADSGGADFGQEFDVQLTKKLGKHFTALAKYAHYDGKDAPYGDVDKVWAQVEFNF